MECQSIKYVRDTISLTNIKIIVPFVKTLEESVQVIELLTANRLVCGKNGLHNYHDVLTAF